MFLETGQFASALEVDRSLLQFAQTPEDQITLWSGIARAAGETGNAELFDQARIALADVFDSSGYDLPISSRAYCCLSRGAAALGRVDEAYEAARTALALAELRHEGAVVFEAETLVGFLLSSQRSRGAGADTEESSDLVHPIARRCAAAVATLGAAG
jgi:hypothetical protein